MQEKGKQLNGSKRRRFKERASDTNLNFLLYK